MLETHISHNTTCMYDIEPHIAEIYDNNIEAYTDDVELIRYLLGNNKNLRILEPFCGTGRILIQLAIDGHEIVGLDQAEVMLNHAHEKIRRLSEEMQRKITLVRANVITEKWPDDFDLVILGGNCLYELATAKEQEECIISASKSIEAGGYIYLDNNHMEGELDESWQRLDTDENAFPTGRCIDGTIIQTQRERVSFDVPRRLVQYRRRTKIIYTDGNMNIEEYMMQCHPTSRVEIGKWLKKYGFAIKQIYGDRSGNLYEDTSDRAIFWAVKE